MRDKSIAHLDKKHVNDPSFFLEKLTSTFGEIEEAYNVVEGAILEIGKYLGLNKTTLGDAITLLHHGLRTKTIDALVTKTKTP